MERLSVDELLAEVLEGLQDLPNGLRDKLRAVVRLSPTARVREIERIFEEFSRG